MAIKVVFKSDGHEEYLETTKTKVLNDEGKIIGVLGIGRNFTAEKIQEEIFLENINKTSFEPVSFDSKYKRKDGTLFDVFVIIVRIKIEEFETIFNYSSDAILVIDKNLIYLIIIKSM